MRKIDISTPKYPNKYAIVDDDDYAIANSFKWYLNDAGYITRNFKCKKEEQGTRKRARKIVYLHRFIMNTKDDLVIDHINHNKLDNRRLNLRECTQSQNLGNKRSFSGSSKFKGVSWCKKRKKWCAASRIMGKSIYIGRFNDEVIAAKAYNECILKHYGEFAYLNKISV